MREEPIMKYGFLGIQHWDLRMDMEDGPLYLCNFAVVHTPSTYIVKSDFDYFEGAYAFIQEIKFLPWERLRPDCIPLEITCYMKRLINNHVLDYIEPIMGPRILVGKRLADWRKEQEQEMQALMAGLQ
jgi:hypothetical protein